MLNGDMRERGKSVYVTAQDGLRLHVCEYGTRIAPNLPVVCLPGLTRTTGDFEALAPALANAAGKSRRVIAIDSRGRGKSEYDSNPENYNLIVELADIVTVMTALDIAPAVFVGSSRGGLLTMLLGVSHPNAIAGVILHDIGPAIEPTGLARIKSYVGKLPQPRNFEEGAEILRRLFSGQFPNLSHDQWLAAAHNAWKTTESELAPTYDVRIARTLAEIDIERPLSALWNEFDALSRVPLLVIRGANSDILSAATATAMGVRHAGMQMIEVEDQGHVPLLDGNSLLRQIADFVGTCDAAASPTATVPTNAGTNGPRAVASNRRGDRWR